MQEPSENRLLKSKRHRVITAGFGVLFIVVAVLIAVWSDPPMHLGAVLTALVIGARGLDALISAVGRTRSLLSRIGPLP
jgi:hypothetical protein